MASARLTNPIGISNKAKSLVTEEKYREVE